MYETRVIIEKPIELVYIGAGLGIICHYVSLLFLFIMIDDDKTYKKLFIKDWIIQTQLFL